MGVLSALTRSALNIMSQPPFERDVIDSVESQQRTIGYTSPRLYDPKKANIIPIDAPKSMDFFEETSVYFVSLYQRASYYFQNCSILSTVIRKIPDEAMRSGLEIAPRFQAKCPKCHQEYDNNVKKCKVCGYDGPMTKPNYTEKKLLMNWKGQSLLKEANRNGWSLQDLCSDVIILTLVYNQPLILCKSKYAVDENGNAVDEIPQEFVPISPTKARMLYDETGTPGKGVGFTLRDRTSVHPLVDETNIARSGYYEGQRLYPARWCVSIADGGWDQECNYYADTEVFHKVYSVPSMTYGTPICSLIEYDIRAWIAMEMRIERYYNTGHPQGIFAISGITPEQLNTIQKSINEQMIDDPYRMPMMGIPPGGGDTVKTAKWFQLADNPTGDMMQVKAELQQRIAGAFGVSGLFLGDVHSIKGNSNEQQQMAIMDRNLTSIRGFINAFLDWVVSKYKGVNDWTIRIIEPADEQTRKQAEDLNKELVNAQLAKEVGFPIISLTDGKIEYGDSPIDIPGLDNMSLATPSNPYGSASGGSGPAMSKSKPPPLNEQESHLFGTDIGDSSDVGRNMIRNVSRTNTDIDRTKSAYSVSPEQVGRILAEMIKNGVRIE